MANAKKAKSAKKSATKSVTKSATKPAINHKPNRNNEFKHANKRLSKKYIRQGRLANGKLKGTDTLTKWLMKYNYHVNCELFTCYFLDGDEVPYMKLASVFELIEYVNTDLTDGKGQVALTSMVACYKHTQTGDKKRDAKKSNMFLFFDGVTVSEVL